jgi:hypothetical protein
MERGKIKDNHGVGEFNYDIFDKLINYETFKICKCHYVLPAQQ